MTDRRTIREVVLQALYAAEISRDKLDHILNTIINEKINKKSSSDNFGEKLFLKTARLKDEFDDIIQEHIRNWKLDRLAMIDKLILRMAICEFLYFDEIPTKVTINEAIEIAKKFSTKKSDKFVNGILDAALESLDKEGRIKKTGRGLIDTTINS